MTQPNSNSSITKPITRCQHRNRTGRQCKLPAVTGSPLCYSHNQVHRKENAAAELASSILGGRSNFASASDINQALSQILIAAVNKRLSTREATAFAYICSLLLRSTTLLSQEKLGDEKSAGSESASDHPCNGAWNFFDGSDSSWMPAVARRALDHQRTVRLTTTEGGNQPSAEKHIPIAAVTAQADKKSTNVGCHLLEESSMNRCANLTGAA